MAADPTKCEVKIINGGVISEWTATFAEFKGLIKWSKPPMGCKQDNWKETMQKWLIVQFFVAAIVFPVQIVLYALAALLSGLDFVTPITSNLVGAVIGILVAFISAWVGWFMLIKREPNCCCCCICYIEGWKFQHLLYGLVMMLNGVSQILNAVNLLLAALDLMTANGAVYVVFYAVATALVAIYGITNLYLGMAAARYGAELAGVKLPEVPETKAETNEERV
jgi:uncharacterized membrane protein